MTFLCSYRAEVFPPLVESADASSALTAQSAPLQIKRLSGYVSRRYERLLLRCFKKSFSNSHQMREVMFVIYGHVGSTRFFAK